MTIKELANPDPCFEMYQKFSADLVTNNLDPGTRLQPLRKLAESYKVSYVVAQQVVKKLQEEGFVRARPGDGIYLTDKISRFSGKTSDRSNPTQNITTPGFSRAAMYKASTLPKIHSIGIVMPFWISGYGNIAVHTILKGILARADQHNWRVELIYSTLDEASRPSFVNKIIDKNVDGVVWVQPVREYQMNLMRLIDKGLEVVATGRRFPDLPLTVIQEDQADLGKKIVEFCLSEHRKKIVVLSGPIEGRIADAYSKDIVLELRQSMETHELELPESNICQCHISPMQNELLKLFLEKHQDFQAIVALHDDVFPVIEEMEREGFWNKPESLAIIDVAAEYNHNLTHVGKIPIHRVKHPLNNIGCSVIRVFEKKWLGAATGPEPGLKVQIS